MALFFSLEGNSPLERIYIPILGATQSAHWGCKPLPIYGAIRHFDEVRILKEHLLDIILNIDCQIYLSK